MWNYLSTNLFTYNGHNSSTSLDKILSVPKKVEYKITQEQSQDDQSGETWPGNIVTRGITTGPYITEDMVPKLPSGYEGWSMCSGISGTDPQTGGLWADVGYCYTPVPSGFSNWVTFQNWYNVSSEIYSITQSLGYDYSHGYSARTPYQGGLGNGDTIITVVTMMETTNRTPIGTSIVFEVSYGLTINDYFVSDMSTSCEFNQDSGNYWNNMWQSSSSFEDRYISISQACQDVSSYDDIVAHLYYNKMG